MELELIRDRMDHYEMTLEQDRQQEETVEAIVPDACPDAREVTDAIGQICLTEKRVQAGVIELIGHVNAVVLYRPEAGEGQCRMEVKMPFVIKAEDEAISQDDSCIAWPTLCGIEASLLNPRKILIRAELCARICVYAPRALELCCGVQGAESKELQQLKTEENAYFTTAVREDTFLVEDEIRLTAGPAGDVQVVSLRAEPVCGETKVIGNKLICKGEAQLQVLYQTEGELCATRGVIPFSCVMEVQGVGDNAYCYVGLCVMAIDYAQLDEAGRTLSVNAQLLAQAAVREQRPVTLLQDAYSIREPIAAEQGTVSLPRLVDRVDQTQSVRESFPTERPVKSVVDASVTVLSVNQRREDDRLALHARLRLAVLYCDTQGEYRRLERLLSVDARADGSPETRCICFCRCPEEVYAAPAAEGIEARFHLEFQCEMTRTLFLPQITALRPGEPAAEEGVVRPSVVLRAIQPGERLWDVAKEHATTEERILKANQCSADTLPIGKMLLIPNAR